jgi:hypothetical protein
LAGKYQQKEQDLHQPSDADVLNKDDDDDNDDDSNPIS